MISIGMTNREVIEKPKRLFKKEEQVTQLIKLKENYSFNKFFETQDYCLQTYIALSYYPELKNVLITFKHKNIYTTMETRPNTISLLGNKENRTYTVYIDNNAENEGITLNTVPFNAQIGIIGHELAHIVDYERHSTFEIAKIGTKYINKKTRPKFEKSIDSLTIQIGLGWQLYDWSDYVLNKSKASANYKNYKRNTYLIPSEIDKIIQNLDIYR